MEQIFFIIPCLIILFTLMLLFRKKKIDIKLEDIVSSNIKSINNKNQKLRELEINNLIPIIKQHLSVEIISTEIYQLYSVINIKPVKTTFSKILLLEDEIRMILGKKSLFVSYKPENLLISIEFPSIYKNLPEQLLSEYITKPKKTKIFYPIESSSKRYSIPLGFICPESTMGFFDFSLSPHLLISGTTGSGKSNFIHFILLYNILQKEKKVKINIIDMKKSEFYNYNVFTKKVNNPIANTVLEAEKMLERIITEMNSRIDSMISLNQRNFENINMPYIIILIDEFAELIENSKKSMKYIKTIARTARSCGISLFLSTQRPSASSIDGQIRSNLSAKIAFKTVDKINSRISLNGIKGAENLLEKGEMLFNFSNKTYRFMVPYIDIENIFSK